MVIRKKIPFSNVFLFEGAKLNYKIMGEGLPIVLVHGAVLDDPWNGCAEELAKKFKVYLFQLPGFGASETVKGKQHTSDLFAQALGSFLEHQKLQKAPVIAFSLGAVAAVKAAVKGLHKGKLILIGAPVRVESNKLRSSRLLPLFLRRLIGSTRWGRKNLILNILRDVIGPISLKKDNELLKDMETTDTRSLVDTDIEREIKHLPEYISELQNRISFIYGEKEKLLQTSKNYISNSFIIKNSFHTVFEWKPEEIVRLLENLVTSPKIHF